MLEAVARAWETQREEVQQSSLAVVKAIGASARLRAGSEPIDPALLDQAVDGLQGSFDRAHGGFGRAPKFPMGSVIEFLLGRGETTMSLGTLRAMASGGIYDQVGGGFSRYAVDATWTVPHFEKMLYDNALLARAYLHGYQLSGDAVLRRTCEETLDWVLREMRGAEGGFYAALDADSEGVEGRFYVWTVPQLRDALGELAEAAIAWFGATEAGNFEGANVLEARGPEPPAEARAQIRARLLAVRAQRVRPGTDDKRLCAWNALMIHALAEAGAALERPEYVDAARTAADFVLTEMRDADGALLRSFKDSEAKIEAYLEDHAFLLQALLALYEATFEPRWFTEARRLADLIIDRFADAEHGGFFTTSVDRPLGFARRKDLEDSPIPSGNSAAALGLLRLGRMTGDPQYATAAQRGLELLAPLAARHPLAFGHALQALDFALSPVREVAIAGQGPAADALAGVVRTAFAPRLVLAGGPPQDIALLDGRVPIAGQPAAYVCEHFTCQAPVTTPEALIAALGQPAG